MVQALLPDCLCIGVMLILLLSLLIQKLQNDVTATRFAILVCTLICFSACNLLSTAIEGDPSFRAVSTVVNLLAFLLVDGLIIAFSAYLATLIGRVSKKWQRIMNPAVFFTYIRIALVLVLFFTGNLFVIDEEGCYQEKLLASVPYLFSGLVMLLLIVVVLNNRRYFTTTQTVVIILYLLLPLPAVAAEMVFEVYSLTGAALTLSVLLIYVMVQSGIIENGRIRESVLEEISSTDLLTNLNNRRAYYNRFSQAKEEPQVGVIFFDINGLKYTNDTFGHAAGDALILRFANLLTDFFSLKDVFRISGDEFVVMSSDLSSEAFSQQAEQFGEILLQNDSIASIGYAYGDGAHVEQLVADAESNMYENKRQQPKVGLAAKGR